jgi:hypothetical protein
MTVATSDIPRRPQNVRATSKSLAASDTPSAIIAQAADQSGVHPTADISLRAIIDAMCQKQPWLVMHLPSNPVRLAHSRSHREGRERMLCQSDLRVQRI